MRARRAVIALAGSSVAALLLVTACTADEDAVDAGGAGEPMVGAHEDASAVEAENRGRGGVDSAAVTTPMEKAFIRVGSVSIEDGDLSAVRREIDGLLARHGGHVADEETSNDENGTPQHSVLVLRVPARAFDQVLTAFEDFTTVLSTERDDEEVTTEVIDLGARIRTQEVSLRRLRGFLGQAENVENLIRLESEVSRREADLQSLRAQADHLADQVALATITVRMTAPDRPQAQTSRLDEAGFLIGLASGWNALKAVLLVTVTAVGAALPFALLLLALGVPLVYARRRRTSPAPVDDRTA